MASATRAAPTRSLARVVHASARLAVVVVRAAHVGTAVAAGTSGHPGEREVVVIDRRADRLVAKRALALVHELDERAGVGRGDSQRGAVDLVLDLARQGRRT